MTNNIPTLRTTPRLQFIHTIYGRACTTMGAISYRKSAVKAIVVVFIVAGALRGNSAALFVQKNHGLM